MLWLIVWIFCSNFFYFFCCLHPRLSNKFSQIFLHYLLQCLLILLPWVLPCMLALCHFKYASQTHYSLSSDDISYAWLSILFYDFFIYSSSPHSSFTFNPFLRITLFTKPLFSMFLFVSCFYLESMFHDSFFSFPIMIYILWSYFFLLLHFPHSLLVINSLNIQILPQSQVSNPCSFVYNFFILFQISYFLMFPCLFSIYFQFVFFGLLVPFWPSSNIAPFPFIWPSLQITSRTQINCSVDNEASSLKPLSTLTTLGDFSDYLG